MMSDRLWRINPKADDRDVFNAVSLDPGEEPPLLPAEPCKHGNYARHIIDGDECVYDRAHVWCDGKPKEDTT